MRHFDLRCIFAKCWQNTLKQALVLEVSRKTQQPNSKIVTLNKQEKICSTDQWISVSNG